MAIPFVVEDDGDYVEVVLQQIYTNLFDTIRQIELVQRSRRARVRATPSGSGGRRNNNLVNAEHQVVDTPPNLTVAVSPVGSQARLRTQNVSTPVGRRRRRRARSEPSSHEESKPINVCVSVEVTNKKWIEQEKSSQQSCGSKSLFYKLVPAPLWTAVICVVGWHLLRAR